MGCIKSINIPLTFITAALLAAGLVPDIFWSSMQVDDQMHKISLWQRCAGNSTVLEHSDCTPFADPRPSDKGDVHKELRDGTIASCVFGVFFSLIAMTCICCSYKKLAIFFDFLTFVMTVLAVGTWVQFMQHQVGDVWKIDANEAYKTADLGLGLVSGAVFTSFVALVTAFCLPSGDKYENLA